MLKRVLIPLILVNVTWLTIFSAQAQDLQQGAEKFLPSSLENSRAIGVRVRERTNEHSEFAVMLDVDRPDRVYQEDETVKIHINSSADGYVYLVNFDPEGNKTLLIPNKYYSDNTIKAGQTVVYPAENADYELPVSAPFGEDVIKVFVTKTPLKSISKNLSQFTKSIATDLDDMQLEEMDQELSSRALRVTPTASRPKVQDDENDFATHAITIKTYAKGDTARESCQKSQRFVLTFGVQKYQDSGIRSLSASTADAKAFANFWTTYGGVNKENCKSFTNEMVTRENVRHIFCDILPKQMKPGDELIVYWSGHGDRRSATRDDNTSSQYVNYLVTYDSKLNDPEQTMLSEIALGQWMQNLSACRIFFVLDACHSGGMTRDAKDLGGSRSSQSSKSLQSDDFTQFSFIFDSFARSKALGQKGLAVLCSSSYDQLSFEQMDGEMSVMTACLLTVMKQSDIKTHKDLKTRVASLVNSYIQEHYPNVRQTVVEQDELNPALILKP